MSSPSHRLTNTGRLVVNLVLAIVIYVLLSWLPPFEFNWLAGLLALAVLASWLGGLTLSPPALPKLPTLAGGKRLEGSIKWFNGTKGFGFITGDDGEEIFVHFRNVNGLGKRGIKPGQRVSYAVVASDRGPQAEDVEPL